ncbi:UNVERIFIED_CONTAM: hypothetical protein K2H54_048398 [Gekko kuhli]
MCSTNLVIVSTYVKNMTQRHFPTALSPAAFLMEPDNLLGLPFSSSISCTTNVMRGEDGEIPTTIADSTVLEQQTMVVPVTATECKGAEGGGQTQDLRAPLPTWAEPTWLLTPNPRSERFTCDGTRRLYGCLSREEPERIRVVEDTEAEHLHREFRGEAEDIRREMRNMMLDIPGIIMEAIQQEFWNHGTLMELGGCCQLLCKCPRKSLRLFPQHLQVFLQARPG